MKWKKTKREKLFGYPAASMRNSHCHCQRKRRGWEKKQGEGRRTF